MSTTKNGKKVVKIVVDIVLAIFLIFALMTTILALASTSSPDGVPNLAGYSLMTVESDSMEPEFSAGDLIIVHLFDSDEARSNIQVGDVITFRDVELSEINQKDTYNTHRVVEVVKFESGSLNYCITKGDNEKILTVDETQRQSADIKGEYTGKRLAGFGKVIKFLCTRMGFFLCVLLPLFIFFIYEIVVVVRMIIRYKNKNKKVITQEDEELIKQQAIQEYLRQQAESKDASEQSSETKDDSEQ